MLLVGHCRPRPRTLPRGPLRFVPEADVELEYCYLSRWAKSGCEQMQQRSPYSSTSSARASSVGGSSRPRALPVLRLMTVSYLVASLYWQIRQASRLYVRGQGNRPHGRYGLT
jgi:hypothetical protein